MKRIILLAILFNFSLVLKAQEDDEEKTGGFKKENLFTGGTLNVSFYNGTTYLGLSPYFGYSITKWLDAAVNLNFNYVSQRDIYVYGDKLRQTVVGPGAFVRIYPLKFLFAQAQFEHNFITQKYIPVENGVYTRDLFRTDVNSLLLGGGFASGRDGYNKSFYFMTISFDVLKLANSPYIDNLQRTIPIFNAGFHIALFQGGGRGGGEE